MGVKRDFSGMYHNLACPPGFGNTDTLPNIPTCSVLLDPGKSEAVTAHKPIFEDIFSPDIVKQKQVSELYIQLMNIKENVIKDNPVAITGTMH